MEAVHVPQRRELHEDHAWQPLVSDRAAESKSTESSVARADYRASGNLSPILSGLGISILATTYQAGKLLTLGSDASGLTVGFNHFDRAMGLALGDGHFAVGTRSQVWFLEIAPDLAPQLEPTGRHDACFLTRSSLVTGEIHGHEMSFCGDELWMVNTRFSCLCTLSPRYSFVPRWQPSFISELAAEDRCHLNGLACENGYPRYVTAFSQTDTAGGWRPSKSTSGCLIDVLQNQVIVRGLCMPHSPRIHDGELYVLDSGNGRLCQVDRSTGQCIVITQLAGFTRGLSFFGPYAFVGLSRIRETAIFGDLPLQEQPDALLCGVAVIELASGELVGHFTFDSGVTEIFSVEVMPNFRCPYTVGPHRSTDEGPPIWYVPRPQDSADGKKFPCDNLSDNP
ncbi:MAG: TIGR03032 family protein [Planctomycetota bacterium]